jgi:hypothetical protein
MAYSQYSDDDNGLSRYSNGSKALPDTFYINSKEDVFALSEFSKVNVEKGVDGTIIIEFLKDKENPNHRPKIIFESTKEFQNLNLRLEAYECDIHMADNTCFENSNIYISSRHYTTGSNVRLIDTDLTVYNSYAGKTNIGDRFGFYSDKKDNNIFILSSETKIGEDLYVRAGEMALAKWNWSNKHEYASIGSNSKVEVDFFKNLTMLYADKSVSIDAAVQATSNVRHYSQVPEQTPGNEITQDSSVKSVIQRIANFFGIK